MTIAQNPTTISEEKLLLVEGNDFMVFYEWLIQKLKLPGIQIYNFGGINELKNRLPAIINTSGFDKVKAICIARDAESDPIGANQSIQSALRNSNLPVPPKPFVFEGAPVKIAYVLYPGYDDSEQNLLTGGLEDTCLSTVSNDPIFPCVNKYIDCVSGANGEIHLVKSRLYTYLAGKKEYVGWKVGIAAKKGAFDISHDSFIPFIEILEKL